LEHDRDGTPLEVAAIVLTGPFGRPWMTLMASVTVALQVKVMLIQEKNMREVQRT